MVHELLASKESTSHPYTFLSLVQLMFLDCSLDHHLMALQLQILLLLFYSSLVPSEHQSIWPQVPYQPQCASCFPCCLLAIDVGQDQRQEWFLRSCTWHTSSLRCCSCPPHPSRQHWYYGNSLGPKGSHLWGSLKISLRRQELERNVTIVP